VKEILEKHPKAAKVKDTNGHLPLHYAIWIKNSDDVINLLFINYPEAALQNLLLLVTVDFSNLAIFYITLPCEQAVYV
jgi:ankyrin repeat protein